MSKKKEKNLGGRPPKFTDPKVLQAQIDQYFNEGVTIRDVIIGKAPNQQVIKVPVPTITGLCYYLGFESRQSFYAYEKIKGFSYTIKKARLFIEQEYEEQLQVGNTVGAIFALKNMGWIDRLQTDFNDITDEQRKRAAALFPTPEQFKEQREK